MIALPGVNFSGTLSFIFLVLIHIIFVENKMKMLVGGKDIFAESLNIDGLPSCWE